MATERKRYWHAALVLSLHLRSGNSNNHQLDKMDKRRLSFCKGVKVSPGPQILHAGTCGNVEFAFNHEATQPGSHAAADAAESEAADVAFAEITEEIASSLPGSHSRTGLCSC